MEKTRIFVQLDEYKRDRIEALLNQGVEKKLIAKIIGVHKSTITREVQKRSRLNGEYRASSAHHKALIARSNSKYQGMKIERHPTLRKHIISELKRYQSPDGIAGRMKEEKWPVRVSGDAIYRWLRSAHGARYCKYICTKRYRKKSHSDAPKRQIIPNMASIHDMPADPGFLTEGDTFLSPKKVSKTSAVLVCWRETKLLKGDLVKSLRPIHTTRVMRKINKENTIHVMVLDQGGENR
jgi:IS30 family transposase